MRHLAYTVNYLFGWSCSCGLYTVVNRRCVLGHVHRGLVIVACVVNRGVVWDVPAVGQ